MPTGERANLPLANVSVPDVPVVENVTPIRKEREAEVVAAFERKRNESQLLAAYSSWERGDATDAQRQLNAVLNRDPQHAAARRMLADLLADTGRVPAAAKELETHLRHHRDDSRAHFTLGLLYERLGRIDAAHAAFSQAIELDPHNEEYLLAAGLDGELPAQQMGHLDFSHSADSFSGATLDQRFGQQIESLECRKPARDYLLTAADAHGSGRIDLVQRRLLAAIQSDPQNPDVARTAASLLMSQGRFAASVEILETAMPHNRHNAHLWRMLGAAHYYAGTLDRAESALLESLSLDNASALTYFLLGCACRELQRPAEANEYFARAAEIDPRMPATNR